MDSDPRKELERLYTSGVPLFSKDAIQNLYDQIKVPTTNPIVFQSINGATFDLFTDGISEWDPKPAPQKGEDIEEFLHQRLIIPLSIQNLMRCEESPDGVKTMFFPLRIAHNPRFRNKVTSEILPEEYSERLSEVETKQAFERVFQIFASSKFCRHVKALLSEAQKSMAIRKVVAFACGSIAVKDNDLREAEKSRYQHALLLFLLREYSIPCFVQEPKYSDTDEKILSDLGMTVLNNGQGYLEVDDDTIVVSYYPTVCVRQVVCEVARPVALFWSDWGIIEDVPIVCDKPDIPADLSSPRLKAWIEEHYNDDQYFLEEDKRHRLEDSFDFFGIYTRKA